MAATVVCLVAAACLYFWRPSVALGFVGGVTTGAGTLSALVLVLNRVVVPQAERRYPPALWAVLHVGKFVLAAAFAYLIILVLRGDVVAFAVGYTVTLVVLFVMIPATLNGQRVPRAGTDRADDDGDDDTDDTMTD